MEKTTLRRKPPAKSSDEANQVQLKMALAQGKAYKKTLEHMTRSEAEGRSKAASNYIVSYAVEEAEGMYHAMDGKLMWHNPTNENLHIEVTVQDATDLRFVPMLNVQVTVIAPDGKDLGTHLQPFMWHPWLYHYGRNWVVPGDGKYTLKVHIDPAGFMRHDKKNGLRYNEPVDVVFKDVKVETGQKKS